MEDKYIHSEIRGRKVIYYLTSQNDIEAIKLKGGYADLFLCVLSFAAGGAFTIFVTLETVTNLPKETVNLFRILFIILLIIAGLFGFLYRSFMQQNVRTINSIFNSEKYNEFDTVVPPEKSLKIIEATYYSKSTRWDATKKLQSMILNNQLNTYASNDLIGDPEWGKEKWLTIRYSFEGKEITKEYNQAEPVNLP